MCNVLNMAPLQVLELGDGLVEVTTTEVEHPIKCGTFGASGDPAHVRRNSPGQHALRSPDVRAPTHLTALACPSVRKSAPGPEP